MVHKTNTVSKTNCHGCGRQRSVSPCRGRTLALSPLRVPRSNRNPNLSTPAIVEQRELPDASIPLYIIIPSLSPSLDQAVALAPSSLRSSSFECTASTKDSCSKHVRHPLRRVQSEPTKDIAPRSVRRSRSPSPPCSCRHASEYKNSQFEVKKPLGASSPKNTATTARNNTETQKRTYTPMQA